MRDREAAETQHVQALADQAQGLLDEVGLSAVGRAQLRSLSSIEAVRRLDKRSMAEVHGLNIKDRQALFAFLQVRQHPPTNLISELQSQVFRIPSSDNDHSRDLFSLPDACDRLRGFRTSDRW